jgi:uncharacterized protein (DUF58 family)
VSAWSVLGLALAIIGALLGAPGLILLGALTLLSRWLTTLWSRYGLRAIAYQRRLGSDRAVWGDEVALDVDVWNGKLLPLPYLLADDFTTDGLAIQGRRLAASDLPGHGSLQNSWSLLWFERVIRHLRIEARRRGVFTFGPIRLTVSDLFERGTNSEERELPATLIVRPRSVPVRSSEPAHAPLGSTRASSSLFHDPALFAGVRPYVPGDPMRRLHWRASARLDRPVSKRFEPIHERQVLLALDLQTVEGPHWLMLYDDEMVEGLCVAAASIARRVLGEGAASGLLAGAQLSGGGQWTYLAPDAASGQLGRLEDALARMRPLIAAPFEVLLDAVPRLLPPGATVITIGARDPSPYAARLRRLRRSGFRTEHVALGPSAPEHCAQLHALGLRARVAELNPDWQSADALVLAG